MNSDLGYRQVTDGYHVVLYVLEILDGMPTEQAKVSYRSCGHLRL
jgi:hypothetical protein